MGSLLLSLAGVDESTLENCPPSERSRLSALGAIVAATACMSAASGTLVAHEFMHVPLVLAALLGICWGGIVLTLDRWMIVSIQRQRSLAATLSLALSRVLLAVALGLVTAPPVLIWIFAAETVTQGTQERQAALLAGKHTLVVRFTEIPQLEAKAESLEKQTGGNGAGAKLTNDPAYTQAIHKATERRSSAAAATSHALCEADGTCGTHKAGEGPDYRLKAHVAEERTAEARAAEERAEQLRATLLREESASAGERRSRAHAELASTEELLGAQRRERSEQEAQLRRAYNQPLGLADRLDALANLAASHPSVGWWNRVLAIIIILLDTSPALGKLVMILGDPLPYDFQVKQDERLHRSVSDYSLNAERTKAEIESKSDVEYAKRVRAIRRKHFDALAHEQVKHEVAERLRWLKAKFAHMRKRTDEQIRRDFGEPAGDRAGANGGLRGRGASGGARRPRWRGFKRHRRGDDA